VFKKDLELTKNKEGEEEEEEHRQYILQHRKELDALVAKLKEQDTPAGGSEGGGKQQLTRTWALRQAPTGSLVARTSSSDRTKGGTRAYPTWREDAKKAEHILVERPHELPAWLERMRIKNLSKEEKFERVLQLADRLSKDGIIAVPLQRWNTLAKLVPRFEGDFTFELLDIDGNGSLDQEEYNKGFDIIDKDHSGLIERSEFGVSSRLFFDVLDLNEDGVLDREEYKAGFAIIKGYSSITDIKKEDLIVKKDFDNVVYHGLIPHASEEVKIRVEDKKQALEAEKEKESKLKEARRQQKCTYTAYFGKCNNKFCRKAIDDHYIYGLDFLCLDPAEAAAAVLEAGGGSESPPAPKLTPEEEESDKEIAILQRLGFIFIAYRVDYWWWEAVEMSRKFLMTWSSLPSLSPHLPFLAVLPRLSYCLA